MRHALALAVLLSAAAALADDAPGASADAIGPTKGAFGLTATFIGGVPLASATTGAFAPTIGFAYFPSDTLALMFDAGFEIGSGAGQTVYGLSAGVAVRIYLGTPGHLRPFLEGGFDFGKAIDNGSNSIFQLAIAVGGGAEYWLSKSFSLYGAALLAVPMQFQSGQSAIVTIATVTPAIGATFYF